MSLDMVFPGEGARLALQIPQNGWQTVSGCLSPGGSACVSAAVCHVGNCFQRALVIQLLPPARPAMRLLLNLHS